MAGVDGRPTRVTRREARCAVSILAVLDSIPVAVVPEEEAFKSILPNTEVLEKRIPATAIPGQTASLKTTIGTFEKISQDDDLPRIQVGPSSIQVSACQHKKNKSK